METVFSIETFFDTRSFSFPQLFLGVENAWEVVGKLEAEIKRLFVSGTVKGNGSNFISIGQGTKVGESALIKGPAIIGKNCVIGHGALLRENCVLGDNVYIGHGVEVKNSIFLENSTAAHLNYVGDSFIGNDVNIAGGAIVANFRLDGKNITIKYQEKTFNTGLLKFGALIGDGSKIGVNSVLNPGTLLGKKSIVYPLVSVKGVHLDGETIT